VANFLFEVTIHMLPYLKCIRLFSVRSSYLPFKIHRVGFRCVLPYGVRIDLTYFIRIFKRMYSLKPCTSGRYLKYAAIVRSL